MRYFGDHRFSHPPRAQFSLWTIRACRARGRAAQERAADQVAEQPFRVLLELVTNAGRVVTREEIQQKLWPADTFVDFDVGLNTTIRKLRQALGVDAHEPRYIETLVKRGHRFVAPVSEIAVAPKSVGEHSPAGIPVPSPGDHTAATLPNAPAHIWLRLHGFLVWVRGLGRLGGSPPGQNRSAAG